MRARGRLLALLVAAGLFMAVSMVVAPVASAAPSITITDPAPAATVVTGSAFRVGWKEKPATTSVPITKRSVSQYSAAVSGSDCSKGSYSLTWTNTSANAPYRLPATGLAAGRCYYWTVTLTDINGSSITGKSGYVRRPPPSDPAVEITWPLPGAFTDAPPADTYVLRWNETASAGVTDRTVTEEDAQAGSGRTCVGVSWTVTGTYTPPSNELPLSNGAGHCVRYTVQVTAKGGATATATSGALLITNAPPPCAYGDVLTTKRDYTDWPATLLDTIYKVSSSYDPPDLVSTGGITSMSSGFSVRSLAKTDLKSMADAARVAGATLNIASAYRSYSTQTSTFNDWVAKSGMYSALLGSARPGHSEHQTGLAIDFKSYGGSDPWNYTDWATTKAGAWMAANAYKYGWLMSYPKSASPGVTCYQYEPWHYRYFGRSVAKSIHDSGLTAREWLWRHGSLAPGT